MMHCVPKLFRRMAEEDPTVQQSVGIRRSGTKGNLRCLLQRRWMSKRCVRAIFAFPVVRCPVIVIEIADTGVTCSDPITTRQYDIEDLIHVLVNGDISVNEDEGFVRGQLEGSEFGPGILESGRYEGSLPVVW